MMGPKDVPVELPPIGRVIANDDVAALAEGGPPGPSFFHSGANELILLLGITLLLILGLRRIRKRRVGNRALGVALGGAALTWIVGIVAWSRGAPPAWFVLPWEASLLVLFGLGLRASGPAPSRRWRWDLPAILVLTFLSRIPWLESRPRGHFEEIWFGMFARRTLEGRLPELFGVSFLDIPLLASSFDGLVMKHLGVNLWGFRMGSVFMGLLAVLFTYLLVERLVGGRLGPAAAAVMVSFHHAIHHYSRSGMENIDGVATLAVVSYLTVRAIQGGGWPLALMAGTAAGVMSQGYFSSRLAPILALLLLLTSFLRRGERSVVPVGRCVVAFLFAFVVALGPLPLYFAKAPHFGARELDVMAVSPAQLLRGDAEAWRTIGGNFRGALVLHTIGHDDDGHYGGSHPFLHPLLLPLVLYGLYRALRRPGCLTSRVALLGLALGIGAGALPLRDLLIRRTLVVVPLMAVLLALGIDALSKLGRSRRWMELLVVGVMVVSSLDQLDYNLRRYPREFPTDLPTSVGLQLSENRTAETQLLTLPDLSKLDVFVQFMGDPEHVTEVRRATMLRPGTVLVSASHAPLLSQLENLPGAELDWPWGRGAAWSPARLLPTPLQVRRTAAARVRLNQDSLTALEGRGAQVELLGPNRRRLTSFPSPLLLFDYRSDHHPRVRQVVLRTAVRGGPEGGTLRVIPWSRTRRVRLTLDGDPIEPGVPVAVGPGRHGLAARFVITEGRDSLQLTVETEGGLACCFRVAPGGPES